MIVILSTIALTVALKSDGATEAAKEQATMRELNALAVAIRGTDPPGAGALSFGFVGDVGALPPNLSALVTNPGLATWNGPYLSQNAAADYSTDAWGVAYSYSAGTSVQSTGSGSTITKPLATNISDLLDNSVTGTALDARRLPPGTVYRDSVQIKIRYPDGAGSYTSATVNPTAAGAFSLSGIPVGRHTITAIHSPSSDTLRREIVVTAGSVLSVELTFPVALW